MRRPGVTITDQRNMSQATVIPGGDLGSADHEPTGLVAYRRLGHRHRQGCGGHESGRGHWGGQAMMTPSSPRETTLRIRTEKCNKAGRENEETRSVGFRSTPTTLQPSEVHDGQVLDFCSSTATRRSSQILIVTAIPNRRIGHPGEAPGLAVGIPGRWEGEREG